MNELLQKHGCSNVFSIPEGLRELMADISREVLREQPVKIFDFITNYLSCLLISREHGILAVKLMEDLCDCRPTVSEHLMHIGMSSSQAMDLAAIIKEEIAGLAMVEGKEKVREQEIIKRILKRTALDEQILTKVCQVARNAYREYWYRKRMLEQNLKVSPEDPWEVAAQRTIELYKRTKPSFSELIRATQRIQAAYRGYYVRKKMLSHLKPKKKPAPQADLPGPPQDIGQSREIDLGRVVNIKAKVKTDDVSKMFAEEDSKKVGLGYDTMMTITHAPGEADEEAPGRKERAPSRMMSTKNMQTEVYGSQSDWQTAQSVRSEIAPVKSSVSQSAKSEIAAVKSSASQSVKSEIAAVKSSASQSVKSETAVKVSLSGAESKLSSGVHKISFAAAPQDLESTAGDSEIPEDIVADVDMSADTATNPPEDLEDVSSAPSDPTSQPSTAPATDVEDFVDASASEPDAEAGEEE